MINLLVLSCGTRNKVVQYMRQALAGQGAVIATDCSPLAPALYEADRHHIVPRMTEEGYIERIFDLCEQEKISGVLSLIDPELSLLAKNEEYFARLGVTVIGSDYALCERSLDKFAMYEWLVSNGYRCARSYVQFEAFERDIKNGKLSFPVFVKPVRGSASLSIGKAANEDEARRLFSQAPGMMVQEYLSGQEIGADVYIDLVSGEVVSIFTKKKLLMRSGETDKAVSFKDDALFDLIVRFAKQSGYRGQIDIDLFEQNGQYTISEVNPRFGGGYPHAHACGCDHMRLILNNLLGRENPVRIGDYEEGIYMMKYNEICIRKDLA